jgi:hypothetical protein
MWGSTKKRAKSPAAKLKKLNTQIQREKQKIEVKRKQAELANLKLKG